MLGERAQKTVKVLHQYREGLLTESDVLTTLFQIHDFVPDMLLDTATTLIMEEERNTKERFTHAYAD